MVRVAIRRSSCSRTAERRGLSRPRGRRRTSWPSCPDSRSAPIQAALTGADAVGQVLPRARDALHVGLAAELPLGADLAGDARHLGGERAELIHPARFWEFGLDLGEYPKRPWCPRNRVRYKPT